MFSTSRYRDWVVSLAIRLTGYREDALDVLQETFTYFLGKFPGFELRARLTTFLYPAVKHLAIAARRKRERLGTEASILEVAVEPEIAASGPRDDLAIVMKSLPAAQREVLLMRFVDSMSLEDIGHALECPTGTVKSRLHLGLARLREDERVRAYFE
jgi:RNA polymerase sigma-70 factor (ECF subfamily)